MRSKSILMVAVLGVLLANNASAKLVRGIDIGFVTIGNAGNAVDTQVMNDGTTGYGAVAYEYQIGKYEVTNGQWNTFVSAAGAPTGNRSDAFNENAYFTGTNVPTNELSWLEAAQFCNYLTSGDKSQGAYQWSGNNANPGDFLDVDRALAVSLYGTAYVIPTEDEWYKAAYYTGSGYSLYANGLDTIPPPDNGWNYGGGDYGSPWDYGNGTTRTMEQNGTFDMMGNVHEWNEAFAISVDGDPRRGYRGGSYSPVGGDNSLYLKSSSRLYVHPNHEYDFLGFRVAAVPEPATLLLLGLGGLFLRKER